VSRPSPRRGAPSGGTGVPADRVPGAPAAVGPALAGGQAAAWLVPLLAIAATLAVGFALELWQRGWWALLAVVFVCVVLLAQELEARLPLRARGWYQRVLALGFPLSLLLVWEWLAGSGILNPRWFPPPSQIAVALWDLTVTYDRFNRSSLLGRPWLLPEMLAESGWEGARALARESHVWATLSRVLGGFALGAVPGVLVGMVMGLNRTVRMMLDATMSAIYVLPKIAIFPILMLVFPNPFGEGPKIAVVAISAFFLVAISTMAGVQGIDKVYLEAGRNFGANRVQMFRHVILPGALPIVFSGLRLALGTALIVIVAVEFVRADRGVGFLIFYYWQVLVTPRMYAALVVVMSLGVGLTALLQWVERRAMPWRRSGDGRT
jgi:ABC-type nitrate/sulfonate/bicarbonate transport system permease component